MLILTRRTGESVNIGNDVTVQVLGIKGNQARLGITAPKEVPVHREEIFEQIQREKAVLEAQRGTLHLEYDDRRQSNTLDGNP